MIQPFLSYSYYQQWEGYVENNGFRLIHSSHMCITGLWCERGRLWLSICSVPDSTNLTALAFSRIILNNLSLSTVFAVLRRWCYHKKQHMLHTNRSITSSFRYMSEAYFIQGHSLSAFRNPFSGESYRLNHSIIPVRQRK